LLARHTACPVCVARSRVAAAQSLIAQYPECNVIISDDGLQHYTLGRDFEIVVIDGERGWGNGMLLPAGPLREPLQRLADVDALVINGGAVFPPARLPPGVPAYDMHVDGAVFISLRDPRRQAGPAQFAGQSVHAVAAIGNPQRFFTTLRELGLSITAHAFPDHHAYTRADFTFGADPVVIMTEKDAVKCERLAGENWWALRVDAALDTALGETILHRIGR
jgi:tetraacyldisaccharide 4'-kinase